MLPITALLASVLALQQFRLAVGVIKLRRGQRISLGDGEHEPLQRANRAFGNLTEYAPIMLLLCAALELNGAPAWCVALLAVPFGIGRLWHPIGLLGQSGASRGRVLGMHLTLWPMLGAALLNLPFAFAAVFG